MAVHSELLRAKEGSDKEMVRSFGRSFNDLKAANGALTSCSDFFSNLRVYASRSGLSLMGVITKLEESYG